MPPTCPTSPTSARSSPASSAGCRYGSRCTCTGWRRSATRWTRSSTSRSGRTRRWLAEPALHVYGAPELTTVAFRCADDDATAELLRRVNAEQRVRLSSTRIDGRFVGRVTVLNHRTDRARVEEAVAAIRRHAGSGPGAAAAIAGDRPDRNA